MVFMSMFCGVAPRLPQLEAMGSFASLAAWLSVNRWLIESLYVEETVRLSGAWRMPPSFYDNPSRSSALLGLEAMGYVEPSTPLNVAFLFLAGLAFRALAYACLCGANRDKMGLPPAVPDFGVAR